MVTIPLRILVCKGWLFVDCCAEGVVGFCGDKSVQEG